MAEWIETDVPARLDRLPWSAWHWLVVSALGITWILDGLEVTLAGALSPILERPEALGLSPAQIGGAATAYLAGAVIGALYFGHLTDRLGRKRLFYITLSVYLTFTALSGLSWNYTSFLIFRALTGAGIGGEYAAINSAIDELIPARVRGQVDLTINATYWIGAALGSVATLFALNPHIFPFWLGWRLAFCLGAVLGLLILFVRHWVPESPRWLMVHGRLPEAEAIVAQVEEQISHHSPGALPAIDGPMVRIRVGHHTVWREIWHSVASVHRARSFLALGLMTSQAFFFNAILFSYGLVLVRFYGVPAEKVGLYALAVALGNAFGPILIGHLFDVIGRKTMIVLTYGASGLLLAVTAWMFKHNLLTATTHAAAWTGIFFIASAAASSAYLTVSEIFPLEIRALAISVFYAIGTLVGGVGSPLLFGYLIQTNSRENLFLGYLAGSFLMVAAAALEAWIGVDAERKSLESITEPLSSE